VLLVAILLNNQKTVYWQMRQEGDLMKQEEDSEYGILCEIFVVSSVVDWVLYIFVISQPYYMVTL
jgi:hypothetical protein